jgi:hypothetical protein
MSRIGKIARLPAHVRAGLNERMRNGESGRRLVAWLNGHPEVKQTLAWDFQGRPITEQNISEWRKGGYQDYERHQEACGLVRELRERHEDFAHFARETEVSDRLASILAVELAQAADSLLKETEDPKARWERLEKVLRALAPLRRADHQGTLVRIKQEKWERKQAAGEREDWWEDWEQFGLAQIAGAGTVSEEAADTPKEENANNGQESETRPASESGHDLAGENQAMKEKSD